LELVEIEPYYSTTRTIRS